MPAALPAAAAVLVVAPILARAMRCCSISRGMAVRRCSAERRSDADGGLVHQPLPGAARSGPARSGGGAVGRAGARAGAEDHQGAVAGGARQGAGLRAAALSQRRDGERSLPACLRRSSASTIWAGSRLAATARTGRRPAWMRAQGEAGDARRGGGDPAMPLAHLIEINALTLDGADGPRLSANWTWAAALLERGCGSRSGRDLVPGADGADPACVRSPVRAGGRRAILRWSI